MRFITLAAFRSRRDRPCPLLQVEVFEPCQAYLAFPLTGEVRSGGDRRPALAGKRPVRRDIPRSSYKARSSCGFKTRRLLFSFDGGFRPSHGDAFRRFLLTAQPNMDRKRVSALFAAIRATRAAIASINWMTSSWVMS